MENTKETEMKSFDIRQILEEISRYNVSQDNIMDFVFQDKENDIAFKYYINMLLQLVEFDEHLDNIIQLYCDIYFKKDRYESYRNFIGTSYKDFGNGDSSNFKPILDFAAKLTRFFDSSCENEVAHKFDILIDKLSSLYGDKRCYLHRVEENNKRKKEIAERIDRIDENYSKSKGFFNRRKLRKKKENLNDEVDILENENSELENHISETDDQISSLLQQMKELFASMDMGEIGDKIVDDIDLHKSNMQKDRIKSVPGYFKSLQKDLLSMTLLIKQMHNCLEFMDKNTDLGAICRGIRASLQHYGARTNQKNIDTGLRTTDLIDTSELNDFMSKTSKVSTLKSDFQKLSEQFQAILAEEDSTEFIKKCADFHFDFLQVHPFSDANGRTSRYLLSAMMATRNYMLPSLYNNIYEKCALYERSNVAIDGDYTVIETAVFNRLGHFHPLITPKIEFSKNTSKEVSEEDLEANYYTITPQERAEIITELKNLQFQNEKTYKNGSREESNKTKEGEELC